MRRPRNNLLAHYHGADPEFMDDGTTPKISRHTKCPLQGGYMERGFSIHAPFF